MRRSACAIDPGLLWCWYVDERLTADDIARRLGCTPTTVLRKLRTFGISVRTVGPAPRRAPMRDTTRWCPKLAYAVGVIATDGNLSSDRRHLAIPSIDRDLLETIRDCLGVDNRITQQKSTSGFIHRLQWSDRALYDWLLTIGLTPAKSLTLRPLLIPDEYFVDFFRGCIDGDGSIVVYTDRYHAARRERYIYERLYVSLVSASAPFIEWVQHSVHRLTGLHGAVDVRATRGHHPLWRLRYAKAESLRVLRWMYYAPNAPALSRKRAIAAPYLAERARPPRHGPGRPVVV